MVNQGSRSRGDGEMGGQFNLSYHFNGSLSKQTLKFSQFYHICTRFKVLSSLFVSMFHGTALLNPCKKHFTKYYKLFYSYILPKIWGSTISVSFFQAK